MALNLAFMLIYVGKRSGALMGAVLLMLESGKEEVSIVISLNM